MDGAKDAPCLAGARAAPGSEPGTSRTLSENHATRPSSHAICFWGKGISHDYSLESLSAHFERVQRGVRSDIASEGHVVEMPWSSAA